MLLYFWLVLIVILIFGADLSAVFLIIMIVVGNGLLRFIFMELMFIVVLFTVWLASATYERSGALSYLWFFSLLIGFMMISMFDLNGASFLVILVILAKLPLVGLHMWLPKVHAEASILGSVFLAGLILKAGSVLFYLVGVTILYVLMPLVLILLLVYRTMDGKVIVAISSVLHITISVVVISIIWYVGWLHVIVSPLMFLAVYVSYNSSSSRLGWSMAPIVLLINLGFPIMGAFFREIYFTSVMNMLPFLMVYVFSALFTLNLYIRGTELNYAYVIMFLLLVLVI